MRKTKLATAKFLAKSHFKADPGLREVYLLEPVNEHDPNDPIKLLEVVKGTLERGVEPIGFAADPGRGIDYPVWIVELSPKEYRGIREKTLHFGQHVWTVGEQLLAR
jgi:hypothetical protein